MNKIVKRLYGSGRPDLMSSDDAKKEVEFEIPNTTPAFCERTAENGPGVLWD